MFSSNNSIHAIATGLDHLYDTNYTTVIMRRGPYWTCVILTIFVLSSSGLVDNSSSSSGSDSRQHKRSRKSTVVAKTVAAVVALGAATVAVNEGANLKAAYRAQQRKLKRQERDASHRADIIKSKAVRAIEKARQAARRASRH